MIIKKNIKILIIILILIVMGIFSYRLIYKNNYSDINVKYVNEIESELYCKVKLYDYNNETGQYDINDKYIDENYLIYYIFNYYNKDYNVLLKDYQFDSESLILEINYEKDIDLNVFKLMKLSYLSCNIKNLSIKNNNVVYKI